jgi:hypothetical protein
MCFKSYTYRQARNGTQYLILLREGSGMICFCIEVHLVLTYFPVQKTQFFPEKCDRNSNCVLCAEGKHYFQTYKYPYIYYT